ncbi:hypothetical protein [Stenotrophomonas sp. PFBMAA-4]|uniref:hypothetical protein n=1 Tax=Stenotrophomonas sp. PFBMAA-4 TaxID=3043301 RepID=UPI0024B5A865|nr:hypothetical protein [Stenotrophomonas sp. PFBMAA-4]MDI9271828.1 hypothetical protein [Stenotrophomonas sp. PFBMAA-4]
MSGEKTELWMVLLFVLLVPMLLVVALNLALKKRGGLGRGWGAAIVLIFAGLTALLMILERVRV